MLLNKNPISNIWHRNSVSNPVKSNGSLTLGVLPAVLLHGAGVSGFDEFVIFGGIGLIVLGLIFLSWRAGRKRKRLEGTRRRRR